MNTEQIDRLLHTLDRIAAALEALTNKGETAPNFTRPIEDFSSFDWSSIGAAVGRYDEFGAATVEWGGYTWTRRNPRNKFGAAIWYSRPAGKSEDGQTRYLRLITFKPQAAAEPLPPEVTAHVATRGASPAARTVTTPRQNDRQEFYELAGPAITSGKLTAQEVNDLVKDANGGGFAAALAALKARLGG